MAEVELPIVRLEDFVADGGWRPRLRAFSCGDQPWEVELNNYLGHGLAVRDARHHLALTQLLLDEGAVAGYVTVAWTSIVRLDEERELYPYFTLPGLLLGRLAVASTYRGQRLGAALMDWVEDFAKAAPAPCRLVGLDVHPDNPARHFYARRGYRVYHEPGERPTLFMARDLWR